MTTNFLPVVLIFTIFLVGSKVDAYRKVCYYASWSASRYDAAVALPPEKIDPSLCTHVIYAFATIKDNQLAPFSPGEESNPSRVGLYERFTNLKQSHPGVKFMLSVGGWNLGSLPFSSLVATPQNRQAFATNVIGFLRKWRFEGLDLDWEYPTLRGGVPEDRDRYTALLQELGHAFDSEARSSGQPKLLLSIAFTANVSIMMTAYNINKFGSHIDFVNLMTYDFHGYWDSHTGHNAPIKAHPSETGDDTLRNVNYVTSYTIRKGMPASKINLGIPLYARTYTLQNSSNDGLFAPTSGPGHSGQYTNEPGMLAYFEVCSMVTNSNTHTTEEQGVSYVVQGDQWISFDDVTSIRAKTNYIKDQHLGGSMVWSLDMDDVAGVCGQGKFPLLKIIDADLDSSGSPDAIGK